MKTKKLKSKNLIQEDQELEKMLSEPGWKSVATEESKQAFQAAALAHLEQKKKESRINLRINSQDLMKLREIATREGMGYQTLMASILHKYASGQFFDKQMVLELLGDNFLKVKSQSKL